MPTTFVTCVLSLIVVVKLLCVIAVVYFTYHSNKYRRCTLAKQQSLLDVFIKPRTETDMAYFDTYGIRIMLKKQFMTIPELTILLPNDRRPFKLRNYPTPEEREPDDHMELTLKGRSVLANPRVTRKTFNINMLEESSLVRLALQKSPEPLYMEAWNERLRMMTSVPLYHHIMSVRNYYLSISRI
jgi:hypothetical protein